MRYAIYYAPAQNERLNQLGSAWLGRDAFTDARFAQPQGLAELTTEPARYGLHATLKPPFSLREGTSEAHLKIALQQLAATLQPVRAGYLVLRWIDGFLAMTPDRIVKEVNDLAAECIRTLDGFRAAASEEELRRRRSAGLSVRQEQYLQQWGYPYVLEDFRFHMTLTKRLGGVLAELVEKRATSHFAEVIGEPITIDALALFVEHESGGKFVVLEQYPFRVNNMQAAS